MGNHERSTDDFAKLGKDKTGKSYIYINKLEDINWEMLGELIKKSQEYFENRTWPQFLGESLHTVDNTSLNLQLPKLLLKKLTNYLCQHYKAFHQLDRH